MLQHRSGGDYNGTVSSAENTEHTDPAAHMVSMSTFDRPEPTTGLRTWSEQDDEPGADVLAVVDDQCMFWEHRDGKYPWWCGYGVTWEYLRQRGPLREVGSYAPLAPANGATDCDTDEERAAAQEDPGGKFDAWLDALGSPR